MSIIKEMGFNKEAEYITQKRKEAIEKLGTKYILHPIHKVQKKEQNGKV